MNYAYTMAKYTTEQIEEVVSALEYVSDSHASICLYYLKLELKRRKRAGKPKTSKLTRKEQVRDAVRKHRANKLK